jgi:hypothetical protein
MFRTRLGLAAFVCACAALAAWPAGASPLTVEFSGSIASLQDPNGIGDGSVAVGMPFAGSLTFDTTLSDQFERRDRSRYNPLFDSPLPFEFAVTLGPNTFLVNLPLLEEAGALAEINIFDGLPSAANGNDVDEFDLSLLFPGPTPPGLFAQQVRAHLLLTAPGGGAISSNALAQFPFDLAAFPDAQLIFEFLVPPRPGDNQPCCRLTAHGRIDRLRVVPEPSVAALLALGLALLVRRRR